jgi:hypothetical protein
MNTQFFCKNKDRWKVVSTKKDSGGNFILNGIDYIEIASADQRKLKIYFLHNLPGAADAVPVGLPLSKENIFIEGGVRVKNILVQSVTTSTNVLTVVVNSAGDFSTYTLKIGRSVTDPGHPPEGFDEQLSSVEFSFKINCPNEFDCKTEIACPEENEPGPRIDYLAKDYSSFTRLMLDRLSTIMPDWRERNAADLQVALVELLAYTGDHLSYYQDAVATEAYLGTARRRISLKRHARLLDYFVHDGCNARTWVHIAIENGGEAENQPIDEGTVLMTSGPHNKANVTAAEKEKFINEQDPVVFETMHAIRLHSSHNEISFYTWGDNDCCLPKGSTSATLVNDPALFLRRGDVIVFEEIYSPTTGKKADADPRHRHAVRLKNVYPDHDLDPFADPVDILTGAKIMKIEWYEEDALPFPLCLTSSVPSEDHTQPGEEEKSTEKSIARGNIVLADHGLTLKKQRLVPATATDEKKYRPMLPGFNTTVAVVYEHELEKGLSAKKALMQDAHHALPVISLTDGDEIWKPQRDLLGSDRFATEFVVEMEQDGTAFLRFGDDTLGKKPAGKFSPRATYRAGNGRSGNIGAGAINTIEWDGDGIINVRNPMPASGGSDAETMEEIRQFAPQAFRTQERAVTESDYVQKTELHDEVQKAAAKFYWTGSWYTVYIIIDRKGGKEIDEEFRQEIRLHLEQYRMAGYDLEIRSPKFVPLDIKINVCVKPGYFKNKVKQSLSEAFSSYDLGDGTRGFFHPDNFTFGQPLYLSAIYQRAMEIQGVASVEIKDFRRWAKKSASEIKDGLLKPSELEILRLDNDPSLPENGKIDFIMLGGL